MRIDYQEIRRPSEALFEEMQALRLSMIRLKPDADSAGDFASFKDYFLQPGRCTHVFRFVAGALDQQLAGFYCMGCERYPEGIVLSVEYLFFHPQARPMRPYQTPMVMFGLRHMLRHLHRPKAFAGLGYPASYLVFKKYFGQRVHTLQSPTLNPMQRRLLECFANTMGADPTTGVAPLRTLPPSAHMSNADYDAQNPNWRAGHGLIFSIPVSLSTVFSNIGWALSGKLRRKRARRS